VGATERVLHEVRFNLADLRQMEGTSWSYALLDPSRENVQALVQSPAVADTHEINRRTFQVNEAAPRSDKVTWAASRIPVLGHPVGYDIVLILLIGTAVTAALRGAAGATLPTADAILLGAEMRHPRPVLFGAAVLALAGLTWTPDLSALAITERLHRPADTVTAIPCGEKPQRLAPYAPEGVEVAVTTTLSCPPTPELMEWVTTHVPVDAIFAVNTWNEHPPSVFFPQQFTGWAGLDSNFLNPDELFGPYLRFYRRTLAEHGAQPFFNERESAEDRRAFVEALGITHVLVDPAYHDVVVTALEGNAMFEKQYDRGGWAVFRVRRP
jgi:hypothetical protein